MIQHCVLGSKISLYFLEHKLANKFIRFNCDGKDYDVKSSELNHHISESNKKSSKKSFIDDLSRRLSKLEFKENNSIK